MLFGYNFVARLLFLHVACARWKEINAKFHMMLIEYEHSELYTVVMMINSWSLQI